MKLSVDTTRFILFLYIQNIPRLSLKSSLITGEEYPVLKVATRPLNNTSSTVHSTIIVRGIIEVLHCACLCLSWLYLWDSLVPRLLPCFQCCTLKNERAWYLTSSRFSACNIENMGVAWGRG